MPDQRPGRDSCGENESYRLIKLKPQRVRSRSVRGWIWARDRGWQRDYRKAIDQEFQSGRPLHWLDEQTDAS